MNHHKFLMICTLKYYLQLWCLVIYYPFYQATVYCTVVQNTIFLNITFFLIISDQLQFFRCEFMNHYKLHNHKFMTIFSFLSVVKFGSSVELSPQHYHL